MTDAQRIQLLTDLLNDAVTQNRDLRAERDSLRTQLFETREQRDEARDDRRVFLARLNRFEREIARLADL